MERESFIFYRSFYEAIQDLDAEQTRELVVAICERALNWNDIATKWVVRMAYNLIKPQLDANTKRYVDWRKGWQFWHLWWAPKWNSNAVKNWDNVSKQPHRGSKDNPTGVTKTTPNVNVNVNVNDNVNDNDKEKEKEYMLDTNVSRNPKIDINKRDVISGLSESVTPNVKQDIQKPSIGIGSDAEITFDDIFNNFYHKSWHKKDIKKSKKLFDSLKFTQSELKSMLYDEKLFKYEYKYRIKDPLYRPKFDTYLTGFNRDWDNQREDRLRSIATYHMSHKDDIEKMKERSTELKSTFWEERFKAIAHQVGKELSAVKIQLK